MAGANLRIELFPDSLPRAIDFYTRILTFKVLRHEPGGPTTGYAHLRRDAIQLGLATKRPEEFPELARDPAQRAQFRSWPTGAELVIEIDDLEAEYARVKGEGWEIESEIKLQGWGLRDFRIRDPDGYYLRITERGGHDGRA